ncbi:MAG: alpha/beta hydrolase fold domain-containing protein [Candidatus Onthomonas sp.]
MKRFFTLLLALAMALSLTACGGSQPAEEPTPAQEPVAEVPAGEGGQVAGTYSFTESVMGGAFEVEWTLTLNEDGTFTLVEGNPMMGETEYTGTYTADGDTVTTGPLEGGTPQAEFFNDDLSCQWTLDIGAGTALPVNYDAASAGGDLPPLDGELPADGGPMDGGMPLLGGDSTGSPDADYPGVTYASSSAAQVMDLYLPEAATGSDPVIVVVHGGGFKFGSQTMEIIRPVIDTGKANGYVVASVDYRKAGEAVFPGALADVKAAVRYLKANAREYGIDPDRIVIWGESAGAYLSLMTALTPEVAELNGDVSDNLEQSSSVAALVDFYGPVEFYTMDEEAAALGQEGTSFSSDGSFESAFVGQAVGADRDFTYTTWWGTYQDQLPAGFALRAWVQVGDSDTSVPCTQSEHFAAGLAEVIGTENVRFSVIKGAAHEDPLFYTDENLAQVFAFLDGALS